ncbi:hypothetical protein GNI_133050 [Gregarina niphandrodes]|uniref:Uncharacterized protein n=1 Tax=Gregarina niphandrodes TaxID=110365 RepID=A0A023B1S4_GRENI|nr:hypothetical protein GNI_133050 [Gregarina niphandrodes]EZG46737.1 hypothetical protein GNI_133050 [Gregarina niphandrodes]|eukprot:XP_011132246.1 hypothetical protein GNI_133050 [Gregarina niphandrodes]
MEKYECKNCGLVIVDSQSKPNSLWARLTRGTTPVLTHDNTHMRIDDVAFSQVNLAGSAAPPDSTASASPTPDSPASYGAASHEAASQQADTPGSVPAMQQGDVKITTQVQAKPTITSSSAQLTTVAVPTSPATISIHALGVSGGTFGPVSAGAVGVSGSSFRPVSGDHFDPVSGDPFDPVSGDPFNPVSDDPFDPVSGDPFDPVSGDPFDPVSGDPFDPVSGDHFGPVSGDPFDPVSGDPFNPVSGDPFDPVSGDHFGPVSGDPFDPAAGRRKDEETFFTPASLADSEEDLSLPVEGSEIGANSGIEEFSTSPETAPTNASSGDGPRDLELEAPLDPEGGEPEPLSEPVRQINLRPSHLDSELPHNTPTQTPTAPTPTQTPASGVPPPDTNDHLAQAAASFRTEPPVIGSSASITPSTAPIKQAAATWKPIVVSVTPHISVGPLSVAAPLSISSGSIIPTPGDIPTPGSLASLLDSSIGSPVHIQHRPQTNHESKNIDRDEELETPSQDAADELDSGASSVSVPYSSDSAESRYATMLKDEGPAPVTLVQRVRDAFGSALGLKKKNSLDESKATESKATESKATESKATESKATESKATESKATESKATESEATESKASEPKARRSNTGESKAPASSVAEKDKSDDRAEAKGKRKRRRKPARSEGWGGSRAVKSVPATASSASPRDFASPDLATSARMTTVPSLATAKKSRERQSRERQSGDPQKSRQAAPDYNPFVAAMSFAEDVRREVAVRARLSEPNLLAPPALARRGRAAAPRMTAEAEPVASGTWADQSAAGCSSAGSPFTVTPDDVLQTPSPIPLEVQWAEEDNEDLIISRNPVQAFVDVMELILGTRPMPYDLTPRSV